MEKEFELIAKTFQGLESLLAKELTALGANNIEIGNRMVSFTGDKAMMYKANFHLRTAIRILKPIKHFKAQNAEEVYDAVRSVDWNQFLDNKTSFAVDSVVYSQEFRHSKFVAYKVKDAIVDYFREKTGERPNICVASPDLQLHIHVAEDQCTLALDSSGESLHRRGYRQESVEAPLNEVLAAGIIMMTGWDGECDFIDPMCGSGTLPIEAALIARNIAPGIFRKQFAFEKWKDFDKDLMDSIYNDDSMERNFDHHIYGYDIDPQAVGIANRNVKAAGVFNDVTIKLQPLAQFTQPAEKAIMVTNPPYGERISTPGILGLYKTIGEKLKHQFVGNDAYVLSYREECFEQIGLKPSIKTPLYNGALECELRKYQIFGGKYKEMRAEGGEIKSDEERRAMSEKKRFKANRDFKKRSDEEDDDNSFTGNRRGGDRKFGRREGGFNRSERGGFDRKERGGFDRKDRREGGFDRKDRGGFDRKDRGGFDRKDRREGGFDRKDRGGFDRKDRREGGFDRKDRGGFDRKDRREGGFKRSERGGFDRKERRGNFKSNKYNED